MYYFRNVLLASIKKINTISTTITDKNVTNTSQIKNVFSNYFAKVATDLITPIESTEVANIVFS